jgi:catechol 2,3-dioxygenase-like lactoylglutathione lyase family enzyme
MATMTIDHVELFVPERRRAASWYALVLGFEVVARHEGWAEDPRGPLMISADGGTTMLALFHGQPQGTRETAGFARVALRVDAKRFLDFLNRLGELGIVDQAGRPVTRDVVIDHQHAWSIYFADPYGHRLEMTTYEHEAVRAALAELQVPAQPDWIVR